MLCPEPLLWVVRYDKAVRVHGLLPLALLMLACLPTAGSAVLRSTQRLNTSLHPPSTQPVFGGYAAHLNTSLHPPSTQPVFGGYAAHLSMSLHPPSTQPVFGGYAGSSASPAVPPLSFEGKISDSCPDDIRENQIQQIPPTLRRL